MADENNAICGNIEKADIAASVKNDPVNHPSHYTSGNIEVIDFIEDQKLNMHLGNAVKYISRAGKKDKSKTVEDLRKAVWYIERYIGVLEKSEKQNSGNKADISDIAPVDDIANLQNAVNGHSADNKHYGADNADNTATSLSETFINTEIFIDFSSELLFGEDEAYICYPVRFATVRFQLMPTKGLIELIDRRRYKLGYKPMYPVDGGTNRDLDDDGWYDFFVSLNSFSDSHIDTCIAAVVAGSDSPDNEEMYTIDLSDAEQELLYDRFDEQCRKYVGKSCEELLKEAKELMEE